MSSDRSLEDVWADQVAMALAKGHTIPTTMSADIEADMSEFLGDEVVDRIKTEETAERPRGVR